MSDINIDELLNDEDRVCVPDHLIQLVKDNLEVVPITIYKLMSNCSEYEYTKEELDWTKDHINQLNDDILLANLDKVKHLDNRIYKSFFKEGKTYWTVRDGVLLYSETAKEVFRKLEITCDREYDYILTECVFLNVTDTDRSSMFNNDIDFLKFGGQYLDKFFETEDEGLTYINEQKWTN